MLRIFPAYAYTCAQGFAMRLGLVTAVLVLKFRSATSGSPSHAWSLPLKARLKESCRLRDQTQRPRCRSRRKWIGRLNLVEQRSDLDE
jgi:hypothetical protein